MATKNLYCIVGPSGSGKSTLGVALKEKGYHEVISHTTRRCRGGDDVNAYHFVSERTFMDMISRNEIFEHVKYAGNYYGTSYSALLDGDFIIVDIPGMRTLKVEYKQRPIMVIGLTAETAELKARLANRGDAESLERVDGDKQRFKDLREVSNCFLYGYSAEQTKDIVLQFVAQCEGEVK